MLFAEADPLGGWAGILLQGGAFALLAYIVVVMYPKSRKDDRDERESRDALFAQLVTAMQAKFDQRNDLLARCIDLQTDKITEQLRTNNKVVTDALNAVCKNIPVRGTS